MGTLREEQQKLVDAISRAPINTFRVKSSQIAEIGHDRSTDTLAIRFKPRAGEVRGPLYHYGNVSFAIFEQLRDAESVGSFFHGVIKPNSQQYPYVRIEEAKEEDAGDDQQAA